MYGVRIISLLVMTVAALHAAVAVVNIDVADTKITDDRVRDFLLGRSTSWLSGDPVILVLCTDSAGERAVADLTGRSVSLLLRGWKRLVFSGTGAMPLQADSVSAALSLVAKHPGAITILNEAPITDHCRIIPLTPSP